MRHVIRFLLPLLLFVGALAWGVTALVNATSRRWLEADMEARAQVAASGAREALALHLKSGDRRRIMRVLSDLARDERIMAAAACSLDGAPIAATRDYPTGLGCELVRARARAPVSGRQSASGWDEARMLPRGRVLVNAIPVSEGDDALGYLLLVLDLSYADPREAETRHFLVGAIALVALAAAIVTVLVARFSWRSWTNELRRLLRGKSEHREFKPILRDVRELATRLAAAGRWSPERLREALTHQLEGESVILVANREPYIHERAADGSVQVLRPASGLVTALEPVMRACSGVWVAHGSGSADRAVSGLRGRIRVPPGEESYTLRRVWLGAEEEQGYYKGFANEGIWPLCHIVDARPTFRAQDWAHYQNVNRKFADAVIAEAKSDDPVVLVQDYHFALLPRMIRERLPRATVITFWHIPWPNSERFGICPWHEAILDGLLGSSILGFHTQYHCNHFLDAVDTYLEARIDREQQAVILGGRPTLVRAYPISIEWPNHWAAGSPTVAECRAVVRRELGLGPEALLGIGVDRLDYTKGIEERLLAVERLLEQQPQLQGRFTFAQLAAPSRTAIERYRQLNEAVEALAARVNERFGTSGWRPIVLLREHHEQPVVFRYYRAADVCYVSSLHDGMNLVAKEFVAARDDERGVLLLSRFTGAARELTEALLVNPYDIEEASAALAAALAMSPQEQEERMRSMRAVVGEFNVYRWAGRMLIDAARLRRRDRLSGRLLEGPKQSEAGEG